MKEPIRTEDYANLITSALPAGVLMNTQGDKFNAMVVGWGHLGTLWGRNTFCAYVRRSRYTREQLDKNGEFTVSIPLGRPDPVIGRVCGSMSGRDTDKVKEAGLTPVEPEVISVPGVREYPLTLECRVIYTQDQDAGRLPAEILSKYYPAGADGLRDIHTLYVGEIAASYIIRD